MGECDGGCGFDSNTDESENTHTRIVIDGPNGPEVYERGIHLDEIPDNPNAPKFPFTPEEIQQVVRAARARTTAYEFDNIDEMRRARRTNGHQEQNPTIYDVFPKVLLLILGVVIGAILFSMILTGITAPYENTVLSNVSTANSESVVMYNDFVDTPLATSEYVPEDPFLGVVEDVSYSPQEPYVPPTTTLGDELHGYMQFKVIKKTFEATGSRYPQDTYIVLDEFEKEHMVSKELWESISVGRVYSFEQKRTYILPGAYNVYISKVELIE